MLTRHPVVPLASFVPGIGEDARALAALARSGRVTAQASVALVNAERQLGATDETFVEALNRDGRVNVRALAAATPDVEVARALLVDASEILTLPRSPRVPEFAEALRSARADVGDALDSVTTASDLLAVISEVVGGNGERRFLLAFQALGEARATGGLVGIYGVLDAESGALRLAEVAPYGDLEAANGVPVSAPPWFWTSYQPQRALEQWPQANVSPNFPVVADIYLQMYERSTGDALDGVIALDPIALEMLLRATDPVRVPRLAEPLTSQNAGDVLMRRSYLEFDDPAAQNDFLRAVVTKVFGRLRDGAFEERALADALAEAATTRHLKIYSRDEGIQERVTSLGVDDNVHRYGPNVQMVFHNNYSVNKVDYFLRREVDVKIRLTEDGDARVTTELALQNGAPRGPKSLLLGPGIKGDPAGMNRMLLSFLVPAEANVLKLEVDGEETAFFENTEAELPVAWQMVEIPPREVRSARLSYVIRRAAQINEAGGHFSFTLYPQTLANPDRYNLSVTPPPDMTIAGPGRASGKLLTPKTIEVSFERAR